MRQSIFVALYDRPRLHAPNRPLLRSNVRQGHLPQHVLSIGTISRRQFHVNRVRKHCLRVPRSVLLQRSQSLGTEGAFPDEYFGVIVQRLEMEDGFVEERGVVSQVRLAQRQRLRGKRAYFFERKSGKDGAGFGWLAGKRRRSFEALVFIVRVHSAFI